MKKPRIYRHGDVLLVEVEKAEGKNTEDRMLASGEEANHGHFVTGKAKVTKQGEQLFVRSMTGTLIRHLLIEQFKEKQEDGEGAVGIEEVLQMVQKSYNA